MMVRRQRKTFVSLDNGVWCPARIVGPQCKESGVRVRPLPHRSRGGMPVFEVAARDSGIGFAL